LSNLFDSENYPGRVPQTLVVGDIWNWKREDIVSDYPPASYTLTYSFRLLSSAATEIALSGSVITESATAYTISVPDSTTVGYTKGEYTWQEYISNGTDRIVLNTGFVTLEPNLDADTSDPRSYWQEVLDDCNATLKARAGRDQSSFSIAARSLSRDQIESMMTLRDRAQYEVNKELNKARIAKGLGNSSTIKARF
jgi:hypothetical protein|tara:strand:+ start:2416 stop:3003 length:588 start_codon:yes stop_codon:yes gene_type:complete